MADRINTSQNTKQTHPLPSPPPPPPLKGHTLGASFPRNAPVHVLQFPRYHILKMPSEESQRKYRNYRRTEMIRHRATRACRHCIRISLCAVVLIFAVFCCIFYFSFRPKTPTYTLASLSINSGFDSLLSSSVASLNPSMVATVRTENPNKKISIIYQKGGSISVYFETLYLCEGDWPAFIHKPKNLTVFDVNLTGSGILLTAANRDEILKAENNGSVPLTVNAKVPVKIKFGFFTSWAITVKISCDARVNALKAGAAILSKNCHVKIHYLW